MVEATDRTIFGNRENSDDQFAMGVCVHGHAANFESLESGCRSRSPFIFLISAREVT
jgi:hypothetical protein